MREKYKPSNGEAGRVFIDKYCSNCVHEHFIHSSNHDDKKCDILSRAFLYDVEDSEYPKEWICQENEGICTNFVYWDWGYDDPNNGIPNIPKKPIPEDPNQLVMPFILDEFEVIRNIYKHPHLLEQK